MLFFSSGNANLVILVLRCCILPIFLKRNNGDLFISIHPPSPHSLRLHRGTDLKAWVFQHWLRFTCSASLYFGTMQPSLHFNKMPSPCWSTMAHSMMLHKQTSLQEWGFKVWAAWALHLWILFKSFTLVSSDHNIFPRSAIHFFFSLPTWFFLSNGFFCTTTPCRPELLIWLTLYFILAYWTLWLLQSNCWPFAIKLWRTRFLLAGWCDIGCTSW